MGETNYNYGVAVFWKRKTFILERAPRAPPAQWVKPAAMDRSGTMGTNDVFVAADLRWIQRDRSQPSRKNVLVYGVHLSSGETAAREHDRLQEINTVLQDVRSNQKDRLTLLMGDFNTDPFDTVHITSTCIPQVLQFSIEENKMSYFRSAYDVPTSPNDGAFTTMKERYGHDDTRRRVSAEAKGAIQHKRTADGDVVDVDKSGLSKRVIDYIFAAREAFAATETLQIPSMDALRQQGMVIPSRWYPSDHFAIAARLKIQSAVP